MVDAETHEIEDVFTHTNPSGFQKSTQILTDASLRINHSRMSLTSIQEEISRLSSDERAKLIDILWESLDEERVKDIESKWAAEAEDRIDAVDRGELETIDGPSALQDLRSSLGK
jgi:putative addiction module component (TIGR02574 family)